MIGASREMVNRTLKDWQAEAYIDKQRGSITILDEQKMAIQPAPKKAA
jgi:CRP-like cAMP-binding protein